MQITMITIEKTETYGWQAAIRGMRNPKNSWDKSDTSMGCGRGQCRECGFKPDWCGCTPTFKIGENDLTLMKSLAAAGNDHGKYLRMITVTVDLTAPLYWWKEFDTYKVGTVADSCSTMHKIHAKEFTLDDFSIEHLSADEHSMEDTEVVLPFDAYGVSSLGVMCEIVAVLNVFRERFIKTHDKDDWWQLIQLLPSSYNQKHTVQVNYQVLKNMYHARKNHKLDEWHTLCEWIEGLPYSELITG